MGNSPLTAITAASLLLLLHPVAAWAQDEAQQLQPESAPTVERVEGVPDSFSLPAGRDAVRNRMEPMVQPLPQPSASPTPSASATPQVVPRATPVPVATARPELEPERQPAPAPSTPPSAFPAQDSPTAVAEDPEPAEIAPEEIAPAEPTPRVVEQLPEPVSEPSGGLGIIVWLLGGAALLGAVTFGAWWLRRRSDASFIVEKIEPYRPPPSPLPEEQPVTQEVRTPPPPNPQPSGLVQTSRRVSVSNSGGFVTSTINARPRGNTTPDGRIVTSLSRGPASRG